MPTRPAQHRPPGMPSKAVAEARRKAWLDANRPTSRQRGYDADWRRCRKLFLAAHPTCCMCQAPATDVDHIASIRERPDLRLSWANLRSLCHPCHSRRTARDQGFARTPGGY